MSLVWTLNGRFEGVLSQLEDETRCDIARYCDGERDRWLVKVGRFWHQCQENQLEVTYTKCLRHNGVWYSPWGDPVEPFDSGQLPPILVGVPEKDDNGFDKSPCV